MFKLYSRFIKALSLSFIFLLASSSFANVRKVAVIIPLEHEAMNQILSGIKESLADQNVEIISYNAQSDSNIMSTIIRQINDQDIDVVMPIGTSTSQMAVSHIKNKAIVATAAIINPSNNLMITGVNDEIPITSSLSRIPILTKIAVIYSASEKVTPEVEELKRYAHENNVELHLVMVQSLAELPISVHNIPERMQAFLILKDHLIVSGINILIKEAAKRRVPIIASDEGSVINGATIAIGVREKDIGIEAGQLTKAILNGRKPGNIPYKTIDSLVLFINKEALAKQNILSKDLITDLPLPHVEIGH